MNFEQSEQANVFFKKIQYKIDQYDKKLTYIKDYNKLNSEKTNTRNKQYYDRIKQTDEFKAKRKQYYETIVKPNRKKNSEERKSQKQILQESLGKSKKLGIDFFQIYLKKGYKELLSNSII